MYLAAAPYDISDSFGCKHRNMTSWCVRGTHGKIWWPRSTETFCTKHLERRILLARVWIYFL